MKTRGRHSSSDFDERLFREYYSVPFRMGFEQGGSRAVMASYNAWNGTTMMVNPVLKSVMINEWGNDGLICTDGGALGLLITAHKRFRIRNTGRRRRSRRASTIFSIPTRTT